MPAPAIPVTRHCSVQRIALRPSPRESAEGYELPFDVGFEDPHGDAVLRAVIAMWISPRKARG